MGEDVQLKSSVGVIGAGIQGVCISLCLIMKGFNVTMFAYGQVLFVYTFPSLLTRKHLQLFF